VKLDLLADMAAFDSRSATDWLMFIDGDAFPIADIVSFAQTKLRSYPLLAVQRRENNGDIQPHPSFCLTTIGFWKELGGNWRAGFRWRNSYGEVVTDVGGNLLGVLQEKKIDWYPMLRTNRKNLHPVFFGIYDDVVYHHGSGFRDGTSRAYVQQTKRSLERAWSYSGLRPMHRFLRRFAPGVAKTLNPVRRRAAAESRHLSEIVFESIQRDFWFYKQFQ
jgi:hypothetical protein